MKLAVPGPKYEVSALNGFQMVVPVPVGLSGVTHLNCTPPHSSTFRPRCVRYHSPSAFGSLDLKNTPPMPVTRFIISLLRAARTSSPVAVRHLPSTRSLRSFQR